MMEQLFGTLEEMVLFEDANAVVAKIRSGDGHQLKSHGERKVIDGTSMCIS